MSASSRSQNRLIVFAGLPGTGKSTLAQRLAREIGAIYLRIDALEQAPVDRVAAGAHADSRNWRLQDMAVQDDTPMISVRCRTRTGQLSHIRTVDRAIRYIDTELDEPIAEQAGFRVAKQALRQVLEGKIAIDEARTSFVAALKEAKLFVA
jgi:putative protein kinase ArgK-like GTPase of G3E family